MQCFSLPKTCVSVSGRREGSLQFGSNHLWEWTISFPMGYGNSPFALAAESKRGPLGMGSWERGPRSGSPGAAAALQGADDCQEASLLLTPAPQLLPAQALVPAQPHSLWAWDCPQWLLASRWPSWLCAGSVYSTELATVDMLVKKGLLFLILFKCTFSWNSNRRKAQRIFSYSAGRRSYKCCLCHINNWIILGVKQTCP